jgi:tRNA threonylcarbamoyladenosine dehydratase
LSETAAACGAADVDTEANRTDGPLLRLYGAVGLRHLKAAHVAVVGIGGVGSWVAEGLARSAVGQISLIDLDHVAESNLNRQVHANLFTVGQAKVLAMAERIRGYRPDCQVNSIDEFVTAENWPGLMRQAPDVVVDACDDFAAKKHLASWALTTKTPLICVGAAGGKTQAQAVQVADLADVTHDPLLAKLRYELRRNHGASRQGKMGLACVSSAEPVLQAAKPAEGDTPAGSALACHGYGSSVAVTATFGMVAAGWVLNHLVAAGQRVGVRN